MSDECVDDSAIPTRIQLIHRQKDGYIQLYDDIVIFNLYAFYRLEIRQIDEKSYKDALGSDNDAVV